MKLWKSYAYGTDWEGSSLIVAESEEKALEITIKQLEDSVGWWAGESVTEITEIDGYKIVFRKGKKISLEK